MATPAAVKSAPDQREAMIRALTFADLEAGKGSERQQAAYRELEWRRCAASYNYWRRNYAWLMLKSGRCIPWTDPFPMQEEQGDAWQRGESTIEVKSRQLGETTNAAHFDIWDAMFHDAVKWNLFGAGEREGKDIGDRVNATLDRLPPWMLERARRTPSSVTSDGTENQKRKHAQQGIMTVSFGLSKIEVRTGSVAAAQGLAGKVFVDDFGKHTDQGRKWQLMYPVIDDPDPANRGQVVIVFNGNGEDYAFHLYQKAKRGEIPGLSARFYNWMEDPRRLEGAKVKVGAVWVSADRYRKDNGGYDIAPLIKAYLEKRLDCPWYEKAKAAYLIENPDADEYAFKAQYPTTEDEAFYISGNSRFRHSTLVEYQDAIRERRNTCDGPFMRIGLLQPKGTGFEFEATGEGKLRLFEEPKQGERYVIGADPSGGTQTSDFATMQVGRLLHAELVRQVAVYQARIEPAHFAYELEKMARWYNEAFVVVEANNHGGTVIDRIKEGYYNLYMRKAKVARFSNTDSDNIGFWADSSSKPKAVDQLAEWLYGKRLELSDIETIKELANYEIRDNGSTEAKSGMTDDLVAALYLMVEGAVDLATFHISTEPRILMPWEA